MFPSIKRNLFKKYLFICGCGHSGTSIMLSLFKNAINTYAFTTETNFFCKTKNKTINDFKKFARSKVKANYDLLVEKTPRHVRYCNEILKAEGQLIIEHRSNISFINKSPGVEERNYGSNSLSFFKKASL